MCNFFKKCLNPWNIDKSVSDIRIRFPSEISFWIGGSSFKLTIQQRWADIVFLTPDPYLKKFLHIQSLSENFWNLLSSVSDCNIG